MVARRAVPDVQADSTIFLKPKPPIHADAYGRRMEYTHAVAKSARLAQRRQGDGRSDPFVSGVCGGGDPVDARYCAAQEHQRGRDGLAVEIGEIPTPWHVLIDAQADLEIKDRVKI